MIQSIYKNIDIPNFRFINLISRLFVSKTNYIVLYLKIFKIVFPKVDKFYLSLYFYTKIIFFIFIQ